MLEALRRMPHAGRMRLVEDVLSADRDHVRCRAADHSDPGYPLRIGGRLYGATLVELGAQAAAVHASLEAVGAAHTGLVLSLGDVVIGRDVIGGKSRLHAIAERLAADEGGARYRFEVGDDEGPIVSGELLLSMRRSGG